MPRGDGGVEGKGRVPIGAVLRCGVHALQPKPGAPGPGCGGRGSGARNSAIGGTSGGPRRHWLRLGKAGRPRDILERSGTTAARRGPAPLRVARLGCGTLLIQCTSRHPAAMIVFNHPFSRTLKSRQTLTYAYARRSCSLGCNKILSAQTA